VVEVGLQEAYEKWSDELVRFATVLVGADDAADVVADAFVQLLDDDVWQRVEQPRAYLFGVVANRARMQHRSSFRRRRRDDSASRRPNPPLRQPGDELFSTEVLSDLSCQQRTFVYLAYWEDWTATEIANHVGVSDGTVRRQLARARTKLREELA
jgi:RNA polymerase sigma-70 factor, ECF subfamily